MLSKEEFIARSILTAIVFKAIDSLTTFNIIPENKKLEVIHNSITKNIKEINM